MFTLKYIQEVQSFSDMKDLVTFASQRYAATKELPFKIMQDNLVICEGKNILPFLITRIQLID